MERLLDDRGRAGMADAVLLEDYNNEDVFIENLEKRFSENFIYVRNNLKCDVTDNTLIPNNFYFIVICD